MPARLHYAKLVVCEHCKTSLFLEDEAVKHVGKKSVLTESPSILQLNHSYKYRSWFIEPYGRIQFEYGDAEGLWDEWWVLLENGKGKWFSVDEGDIAVETTIALKDKPPDFGKLFIGEQVMLSGKPYRVTELNHSKCVAVEGELPEVIFPGEVHEYAHLSGKNGEIVTLEYFERQVEAFKGSWIDPFDIQPL